VSDESEVPVKLYYRIGEVSQIVGVEPHVLRYWETEFRSIRPQKSRKGQRIYSRRDVDKLLKVRDLLYTHGFTIAGARRRLREGGETDAEPEAAPSVAVEVTAAPAPAPAVDMPTAQEPSAEVRSRAALVELRQQIIAMLQEFDRDER